MPELPEVETIVRELNATLPERLVRDVRVFRDDALGAVSPAAFRAALVGRRFGPVARHGKYLIFRLVPEGYLVAHLRMTGKFILSPALERPLEHHRVWFQLDREQLLVFQDMRCFGTLAAVRELGEVAGLARLGVDPYSPGFTRAWLIHMLGQSRTPLKHWLMDQTRLAGLGNIYVCEALFRAGLSPRRPSQEVSAPEAGRLYRAIKQVLAQAIRNNGTTISDYRRVDEKSGEFQRYLRVYGREGEPCPRCGAPVMRMRQQQRSTFYCGACQA